MGKRQITDKEFEEALANPDVRNILNTVSKKYVKTIEQEDLSACKNIALWRALEYHDPDHASRQKFTTTLYNFMSWECQKQYKLDKQRISPSVAINGIPEPSGNYTFTSILVNDCINNLSNEEQNLIRYKYFDKLTLKEISEKMNYSPQTINTKLKKALENFKAVYMKGEEDE